MLNKIADGMASVVIIVVCAGILLGIAVFASRHVTCVNVFDKVCIVY